MRPFSFTIYYKDDNTKLLLEGPAGPFTDAGINFVKACTVMNNANLCWSYFEALPSTVAAKTDTFPDFTEPTSRVNVQSASSQMQYDVKND